MIKAFISHSSKDKPFVRKLKDDLIFNEIDTWVDEDELKAGDKLYESLMLGLQNSSHFILVLSNYIKNSHWVETEINEAINALDKKILRKIIPIILRKTEIPDVFKDLLYIDFSDIVFSINDGKAQTNNPIYNVQLEKLVNSIINSKEYILSNAEIGTIVTKTSNIAPRKTQKRLVCIYEVYGFSSNADKRIFVRQVKQEHKESKLKRIPVEEVVPIILPRLLEHVFKDIKIGDKIFFPDSAGNAYGHFCGFSKSNTRLILPYEIRKQFDIKSGEMFRVAFDTEENEITFYEIE